MKAVRVVLSESVNGAVWLLCGAFALVVSLAKGSPGIGTFGMVLGGGLTVALAWLARTQHRRLSRCEDAPADVVLRSPADAAWRAVVGALPAGTIVYLALALDRSMWILAVGYIVAGLLYVSLAGLAARMERRRGGRVVRTENNRFYLAH